MHLNQLNLSDEEADSKGGREVAFGKINSADRYLNTRQEPI